MKQITIPVDDYLSKVDNSENNFLISDCNKSAYLQISQFFQGYKHDISSDVLASGILILNGESKSGKSLLISSLLADENDDFKLLKSVDHIKDYLSSGVKQDIIFDNNIENLSEGDQEILFHLYNNQKNNNLRLLLTLSKPIFSIKFYSEDLKSRIYSEPIVNILPPDDNIIKMLLIKYFSDKQINISNDVLNFLLPRIERKFTAIFDVAKKLDSSSIEHKRNITIPFVKEVLGV